MPNLFPSFPSRVLRPAFALLVLTLLVAGCGHRTAGIRNADEPKAVKGAVDGVWTLTLNPDVVQAGGQSKNIPLSLATKKIDAVGGTLDGKLAGTALRDGKFTTGGDLNPATVSFTSGDVSVPGDNSDAAMVQKGPLQWQGSLIDDNTLTGTVTGGGQAKKWTARKN